MDYLTKIYKQKCTNLFSELGFKSYRKNFYRVVNDMFQSFQLHKSVSGNGCTVEFVVAPLCKGDSIDKTYCGPDHLKKFESDYSWFQYDRNNESSMDSCVDEMVGYMKKYLIPYFQLCDNSKQAYFATCDFQKNNYRKGIFLADPLLFYMALKAELYDKSIEHLIAQRDHTENAYKINKESAGGVSPEYEKRIQNKIEELNFQIKMLSEHNREYIQRHIHENECKALLNLGMIKTRGRFCCLDK